MKDILLVLSLVLVTTIGFSQDNDSTKSTYTVGKVNPVKNLLPGAGTLKGTVYIRNEKTVVPLAFIDVEGTKRIQADTKGNFEMELDTGTYKITISSVGYKDAIINGFTIKWGKEHNITVSLASTKGFRKN